MRAPQPSEFQVCTSLLDSRTQFKLLVDVLLGHHFLTSCLPLTLSATQAVVPDSVNGAAKEWLRGMVKEAFLEPQSLDLAQALPLTTCITGAN